MQAMPIRIFLVLFILALIYSSPLIAARLKPPPEIKRESPTQPEILKSNAGQRESAEILPGLSSAPERRTALVIGNGSYETGRLKNPVNDATDMAATLKRLGFNVILKTNASQRVMDEAVREFGRSLTRSDVGLFYFAGHGIQTGGSNYLIPVSARIEKEEDVRFEAIDAGRILSEMDHANNGLNIVLLDACRNNPFARSFRSESRGLAIIGQVPKGAFISYATAPGDIARDGDGRNSPYTGALLQYMQTPGVPIETVFKRVRLKLDSETGGKQVPWESSSLKGDFYFVPSGQQAESPQAAVVERPAPAQAQQDYALSRPPVSTTNEIKRDGHFIVYDNGTVLDTKTNLMWAAKDNGSKINWANAKSYCENYRGGGYTDWRMPTQDELAGLYNKGIGYTPVCAASGDTAKVHLANLITVSCWWVWASETRGSEAVPFSFLTGVREWFLQSIEYSHRALPVRSGK